MKYAPHNYQAYRNHCIDCNEYVRSTADFYFALENAGFSRVKSKGKKYIKGLRVKEDNGDCEEFLT